MLKVAIFTRAKVWRQPKCVNRSSNGSSKYDICIYIFIYIPYIQEYHSALKKEKEILLFVTTLMNLEGIMLSEISQRKTNTAWYHLHVKFLS